MSEIKISNPFYTIVLFIVSSIISGCSPANKGTLTFPVTSNQILDYYASDPELNPRGQNLCDLYLLPKYKTQTKLFNEQEQRVLVKGDRFTSEYVTPKIAYFELGHFNMGDYLYKLLIYSRDDGVSDTVVFNTQLNSYDNTGILKDALLLDSRFCYEDIERFSDFTIDSRGVIDINRYLIRVVSYEHGDTGIDIENPVAEDYAKEQYQIDNGIFKLISYTDLLSKKG